MESEGESRRLIDEGSGRCLLKHDKILLVGCESGI